MKTSKIKPVKVKVTEINGATFTWSKPYESTLEDLLIAGWDIDLIELIEKRKTTSIKYNLVGTELKKIIELI